MLAQEPSRSGGHCLVCRSPTGLPPVAIPGLRGEDAALRERLCSAACAEAARRFAARRSHQLAPARAGGLVAALGLLTAVLFVATGRDLGRPLAVVSLLAAGTSRIAYPEAVAPWSLRRWGAEAASRRRQWSGVALGLFAVALAAALLVV